MKSHEVFILGLVVGVLVGVLILGIHTKNFDWDDIVIVDFDGNIQGWSQIGEKNPLVSFSGDFCEQKEFLDLVYGDEK